MRTIQWLAALAACSIAIPAIAAPTTTTFDFNSSPTSAYSPAGGVTGPYTQFGDAASYNGLYNAGYFGNSATYAGTGGSTVSATVTAWASTGTGSSTPASGTAGSGVNNTTVVNGTIQNAVLTAYQVNNNASGQNSFSGNGYALADTSRNTNGGNLNHDFTCTVSACTDDNSSPDYQHALDNTGAYETLLFSFTKAVTLSSVTLGFPGAGSSGNNSDATVMYCITNCNTAYFAGKTYSQLVSSGSWGFVNVNNISSTNDTGLTGLSVTSTYWMVGAYIQDLPGQAASDGVDYLKVRAITTTCTTAGCTSTNVPEPGSIALFGIAGAALFIGRRRRGARTI